MIISHTSQFVFVKVPHTASTSVQVMLERLCGRGDIVTRNPGQFPQAGHKFVFVKKFPHLDLDIAVDAYMGGDETLLDSYYKCCVVRNPFTHVLSYFYGAKNMLKDVSPDWPVKEMKEVFGRFVSSNQPRFSYEFTLCRGKPVMNSVIRFENLKADYAKICERFGLAVEPLPQLHVHRKVDCHWSELYTKKTRNRVEKMAKDTLEAYGYEFEQP